MKHAKRLAIALSLTVFFVAGPISDLKAQTTDSVYLAKIFTQCTVNALTLFGNIADNFSKYKGDFVAKMDGDIGIYKVKEPLNQGATSEFIMIKPNGSGYYVAVISGDQVLRRMYRGAYFYGINAYAKANNVALVSKKDEATSAGDKEVYFITTGNTKVGSFTYDGANKTVNIVIGVL